MKIGLFTDTFYPEINGVATSCLNLQRELTRRGHEVHVYAPKCKGWEENQRENVHYLASAPLLVLKDRNFAFPTPLTSWEAEKIDFDVVHTNSEFVMGMFGHHVAGSLGCAQVHTYHTVWEDYTYYITHGVADEAARRIARKYSQWWCNRFDRVITPTGKTLDLLRKYGVAAPIDIIPSGMDIARFDPARHGEQERLETRRECGLPERAPLLLNIGGQPTYFMSLKDSSELVKMYAMVNVAQYQIVATGTSVAACESDYVAKLRQHNISVSVDGDLDISIDQASLSGKIAEIRTAVLDGDSWYYIRLDGSSTFYAISATADRNVVVLNVGDSVRIQADSASDAPIIDASSISTGHADPDPVATTPDATPEDTDPASEG